MQFGKQCTINIYISNSKHTCTHLLIVQQYNAYHLNTTGYINALIRVQMWQSTEGRSDLLINQPTIYTNK